MSLEWGPVPPPVPIPSGKDECLVHSGDLPICPRKCGTDPPGRPDGRLETEGLGQRSDRSLRGGTTVENEGGWGQTSSRPYWD